jgi:hypothetical protein
MLEPMVCPRRSLPAAGRTSPALNASARALVVHFSNLYGHGIGFCLMAEACGSLRVPTS